MHQIKVSDFVIDVVRKDIKNMHLAVYPPTGRVRIAAPLRIDDEAVRLFAISKLGWIKRNQRNFAAQERQNERAYIDRENHYFLGKRYLLQVDEIEAKPQVKIKNKTVIVLQIRPTATLVQKELVMNNWYRQEIKKAAEPLIMYWCKKIGVDVPEWQVKQMKTKWGTCNIEAKRIWLNLELAKKPLNSLEYIIVHELIHLLERHHNDRFLGFMNKYLPNWVQLKNELNRSPISHSDWEY
jgi:predicted metal-dependent hydrolase